MDRFSDGACARLFKQIGRDGEEQNRLVSIEALFRLFKRIEIDLIEIFDVFDDFGDKLAEVRIRLIDNRYGELQVLTERIRFLFAL